MTPAERRAALVERGVREMQDAAILWLYENPTLRPENIPYELLFTAALTVLEPLLRAEALEEAAKVADGYHRIVETRRDLFEDGNVTTTTGHSLVDPRKIAAAIRSLTNK